MSSGADSSVYARGLIWGWPAASMLTWVSTHNGQVSTSVVVPSWLLPLRIEAVDEWLLVLAGRQFLFCFLNDLGTITDRLLFTVLDSLSLSSVPVDTTTDFDFATGLAVNLGDCLFPVLIFTDCLFLSSVPFGTTTDFDFATGLDVKFFFLF